MRNRNVTDLNHLPPPQLSQFVVCLVVLFYRLIPSRPIILKRINQSSNPRVLKKKMQSSHPLCPQTLDSVSFFKNGI
jgi:hypothetical protein